MSEFAKAKRASSLTQARSSVSQIVGVDRLDYTKGLPQKFKAFGRLLDKYPHYQRQVVLTQIAPPTRESVEGYSDIRHELESLAGSINGRLGELDWVPIHYIYRSTSRRTLADIYRSSRVCMVTPLRDGMNLIAKEYVAAQDSADPGVLILSKFAGAAEEMTRALIVNPYSIEETADAIKAALEMNAAERRERHGALLAGVQKHDATAWSQSFLEHLKRVRSSPEMIRDVSA
jgi:trehalose 6-phosphate synthase